MYEVTYSCPRCGTELAEGGDGSELWCETCQAIISDAEITQFEQMWGDLWEAPWEYGRLS